MRKLGRVHDVLTQCGIVLSALLLGLITFFYTLEVVLRYIFNAPTTWTDEAISYSLLMSVFLAMPHVTKIGGHVAVTIVVDKTSPRVARAVSWVIYLVAFIICSIGTWISLDENIRQYVQDVFLMRVHPIPKWWISIFITFGFGLSALHFLRKLDPRATETLTSGNV
jgi:TRAP-type C4-dicarboxylate transport system permease small subunit